MLVDMPLRVPFTFQALTIVGAGAISAIGSTRIYRPISGDDLQGILWAGIAVGLTGVLHMAGGAVWLDRYLFTVGFWISAVKPRRHPRRARLALAESSASWAAAA